MSTHEEGEKPKWGALSHDALVWDFTVWRDESMSLAEWLLGAAAVTALDDFIAEMGMTEEVAALDDGEDWF